MMTYQYFEYGEKADGPAAFLDFVTGVLREADVGDTPAIAVRLDALPRLETATLRSLITSLRRVRESGGSIALMTRRHDIVRSLSTTGLNRVFTVVGESSELPA